MQRNQTERPAFLRALGVVALTAAGELRSPRAVAQQVPHFPQGLSLPA